MDNNVSKLYRLGFWRMEAYLLAVVLIAGNIVLPQLCHLMPHGGLVWLPIYFFTLIGAYKYGWFVGLVTAVVSPLANSVLFGMPAPEVLPIIMIKGVLLAFAAGYAAKRFAKVSIVALTVVVLAYQIVGCGIESVAERSLSAGFQDFRIGLPGMAIQVVAGWVMLKYALSKI